MQELVCRIQYAGSSMQELVCRIYDAGSSMHDMQDPGRTHTNTEGPAGGLEAKENTHRETYWGTAVAGPD